MLFQLASEYSRWRSTARGATHHTRRRAYRLGHTRHRAHPAPHSRHFRHTPRQRPETREATEATLDTTGAHAPCTMHMHIHRRRLKLVRLGRTRAVRPGIIRLAARARRRRPGDIACRRPDPKPAALDKAEDMPPELGRQATVAAARERVCQRHRVPVSPREAPVPTRPPPHSLCVAHAVHLRNDRQQPRPEGTPVAG